MRRGYICAATLRTHYSKTIRKREEERGGEMSRVSSFQRGVMFFCPFRATPKYDPVLDVFFTVRSL
jgi:hypothetical protein